MIDTNTARTIGESAAGPTRKASAVTVIPSEPVKLELYRLWKQNRKWLIAIGCPDRRPLFENDHFTWLDTGRAIAIAHKVQGLSRLQWGIAGKGGFERRYAAFLLPNGQIASFDLMPGADLWVTISFFAEDEIEVLAAWINGCRSGSYQWIIQGE